MHRREFELVSNSLRYSGAGPGQTTDVRVTLADHVTQIEVRDPGSFDRSSPPKNPPRVGVPPHRAARRPVGVSSGPWGPTVVWIELDVDQERADRAPSSA